jgi:molybdate transport system substrate-binding protein
MNSISGHSFTVLAGTLILATSCSRPAPQPHASDPDSPLARAPAPLIASVAASTTEVIEELNQQFHKDASVDVNVNAGPSNALAAQILAGAPADVFLSASPEWTDKLEEEGRAAAKTELLSNLLIVVVPKGNPAGVHEPKDLAAERVKKLALAGENVPAGKYADQALTKLGLLEQLTAAKKVARGEDVRATLSFVERGEAEAGVVYATDARAVPGVEIAFQLDPALHEKITYVLVLVKNESANPAAQRYYDFLRGSQAAEAFEKFGFTPLSAGEAGATAR